MESKNYIRLKDLEVYQLARQLSSIAWEIYDRLPWQQRKVIGDQFLESADSVGANIVEGYSRFHYLDKIKFYYNSRGSLTECCCHWAELLEERKLISEMESQGLKILYKQLSVKLNNFITATYASKYRQS